MTRLDIYQLVTDRMIALLEKGVVPWRRPWRSPGAAALTLDSALPRNLVSRRPYRGVNTWMLLGAGYSSPLWLTFNQARKLGGCVRKGEKATPVVFWKVLRKKDEETGEEKKVFFLRYYNVFNLEQTDGVRIPATREVVADATLLEPDARAEQVAQDYVTRSGVRLLVGPTDRACYSPEFDTVEMPSLAQFRSIGAYYRTLFHELTHSTGHSSRQDRLEPASFGSDPYAKEELVAEMGAAFVTNVVGLGAEAEEKASAAYLAHWIQRFQDDKRLLVYAAAAAQRAADLILGGAPVVEAEEAEEAAA